jgi:predicted DNA-binding transcriptional regulator AlpA
MSNAKPKPRRASRARRAQMQEALTDCWWSSAQVCGYLNIDASSLWRIERNDPTFPVGAQFEKRSKRWRRSEITAWAESKLKPAV